MVRKPKVDWDAVDWDAVDAALNPFARLLTGFNNSLAEDLVQQAKLKLLTKLKEGKFKFRSGVKTRCWLRTTLKNDFFKRCNRDRLFAERMAHIAAKSCSLPPESPEDIAEEKEFNAPARQLFAALDDLRLEAPEAAKALKTCYFENDGTPRQKQRPWKKVVRALRKKPPRDKKRAIKKAKKLCPLLEKRERVMRRVRALVPLPRATGSRQSLDEHDKLCALIADHLRGAGLISEDECFADKLHAATIVCENGLKVIPALQPFVNRAGLRLACSYGLQARDAYLKTPVGLGTELLEIIAVLENEPGLPVSEMARRIAIQLRIWLAMRKPHREAAFDLLQIARKYATDPNYKMATLQWLDIVAESINDDKERLSLLMKLALDGDPDVLYVIAHALPTCGEAAIPTLSRLAHSYNSRVRLAVAKAAVRLQRTGRLLFLALARDQSKEIRDVVAFGARFLDHDDALIILGHLTKGGLNRNIIETAAVIGGVAAVNLLDQFVGGEYDAEIALAAGQIGTEALPLLDRLSKNPSPWIRECVARASGEIGAGAMYLIEELTMSDWAAPKRDKRKSVRLAVARAALKMGLPALPLLEKLAKDSASTVRQSVVSALGRCGQDGISTLSLLAKDPAPAVRGWASQVLSHGSSCFVRGERYVEPEL